MVVRPYHPTIGHDSLVENGRLGPASWQRPTADTDTLVNENNEIFELLMDMEIKRFDHSCYKLLFDTLLRGRQATYRVP